MKYADFFGVEAEIEPVPEPDLPSPDEPRAVETAKAKLVGALIARGFNQAAVAKIMGCTTRTVKRKWRTIRPGAPIPKLAPVFGADPDWSPQVEAWRLVPDYCPRCGADQGPIQPGVELVCLACGRSGFDDQVAADRQADQQSEVRREAARKAEATRRKAEKMARRARRSG
jgi:hypothetical protein